MTISKLETKAKLPSGKARYRIRLQSGNQKVDEVIIGTKSEARTLEGAYRLEMRRGTFIPPDRSGMSFAEWVEEYRQTRTHVRPSTREREEVTIRKYLLPTLGEMPLNRITPVRIQNLLDDMLLAPSTKAREYATIRQIFGTAVERDALIRTPCRGIRLPQKDQREKVVLTPDQVQLLHDNFADRYRAMVDVMAYGGLRPSEAAALKRSDILWNEGQIYVQRGLVVPASGPVVFGALKTRCSKGKVDIPTSLSKELAAHCLRYGIGEDDLFFTSPEGHPLRLNLWRRRFWNPVVRSLGFQVTPHSLRHGFVSWLIDAGVPVDKVCEQARHASPVTTWTIYRHQMEKRPGQVSASAAALERVWTG